MLNDKEKNHKASISPMKVVLSCFYALAVIVVIVSCLIFLMDWAEGDRDSKEVSPYIGFSDAKIVNQYQDVYDFKLSVEAMPTDPSNVKFISRVDFLLSDKILTVGEYDELKRAYIEIKDNQDKMELIALLDENTKNKRMI